MGLSSVKNLQSLNVQKQVSKWKQSVICKLAFYFEFQQFVRFIQIIIGTMQNIVKK